MERQDETPLEPVKPRCPLCHEHLRWSVAHTDQHRHTEVWTCSNPECPYEEAVTVQSH